jgi:hypothetical protein
MAEVAATPDEAHFHLGRCSILDTYWRRMAQVMLRPTSSRLRRFEAHSSIGYDDNLSLRLK